MMSNLNVKRIFAILAGVLLISSCGQPVPTVTSTPTAQPSVPSLAEQVTPTSQPTSVPATPTEQAFVMPGGRLLFSAAVNSDSGSSDPSATGFDSYFWLHLPDMTVEPHAYLIGQYPMREQALTLSPDFAHLTFAQETYTSSGDNLYANVSVSVLLSNPDSNDGIQVGQPFTADAVEYNFWKGPAFSWSANSQVFAFARTQDWNSFEAGHHLYVYDVPTATFTDLPIQIIQPFVFAVSPDGNQIAITDISISPGLFLINRDGSDQRIIAEGRIVSNVVWHPDGTRIFFVNNEPELGIYSVDISTGVVSLITTTSDKVGLLKLSPDGSLLSYSDFGINVVDSNGGEPLRLTGGGINVYDWTWSPDSQYIATIFTVDGSILVMDKLGKNKVRVYDDDGLRPVQLIGWLP